MKSLWRAAFSVTCIIAMAATMQSCGGSKQNIQPLTITSASLPNGTVENTYSEQIQASGGVGPYHWSVSAGNPPHNIQLGSSITNTDAISGTPDTPVQADAFTVMVSDSANQSAKQDYTVSILALPDTLSFSPSGLVFIPELTGTASATQSATLANTGSSAVAISNVAATGTNAGDFSQSSTCGLSLAAGASCVINVTFTPSGAGPRVASIKITDDTAGSPHQLALGGIGLSSGPDATLSGSSLAFVSQGVGTTSPSQTLTLTNYGMATLNITGITATANFAESSTCGSSLAPAASCQINVTFSPSSSGNATGALSVASNASGSPQTASLSGAGSTGQPILTGWCFGLVQNGTPNQCGLLRSPDSCALGETAIQPQSSGGDCFPNPENYTVDKSRGCYATASRGNPVSGYCVAQTPAASARAGSWASLP